jgi:hypothetical protein
MLKFKVYCNSPDTSPSRILQLLGLEIKMGKKHPVSMATGPSMIFFQKDGLPDMTHPTTNFMSDIPLLRCLMNRSPF